MLDWLEEHLCYLFRPETTFFVQPKRILLFAPGSIRTAFRTLSPLLYLTERFPDAEFAVVVSPDVVPLFEILPSLAVIFPLPGNSQNTSWQPTTAEYRIWSDFTPDWIVVANPGCARIADRLPAPVKIGYCNGPIDRDGCSGWLTHSVRPHSRWRDWFNRLDGVPDKEYVPDVPIPGQWMQFARERWGENSERSILLLPGSDSKQMVFWYTLETSLQHSGYFPLLARVALAVELEAKSKRIDRSPPIAFSPLELLALCATAKVCITGDETNAAIATISGTPTGRYDTRGGLWEGDRSRFLHYRYELDADLATAFNFVRDIVPPVTKQVDTQLQPEDQLIIGTSEG